jgi:hypothetical protein
MDCWVALPQHGQAVNGLWRRGIPSTFVSSTEINATFPAYALAAPGNQNVTVTTPAPSGGTGAARIYTTLHFDSEQRHRLQRG